MCTLTAMLYFAVGYPSGLFVGYGSRHVATSATAERHSESHPFRIFQNTGLPVSTPDRVA